MNPNPYESPRTDTQSDGLDPPPSRAALATTIRAFLDSQITAFEFDEQLNPFRSSHDPLIKHITLAVWFHYDDCTDHYVRMSKQEWDYFQRLLLALEGNCRLEREDERRWSVKQLVAAVALCLFGYYAMAWGWGSQLYILAMPFGLVSIALSFWRRPERQRANPFESITFPFASFADLSAAYHSAEFRKSRYPQQIARRTIRSPFMSRFFEMKTYIVWLMFSPVVLFFQMLPERCSRTRVKAV
jgi:hypothetical protein